MPITLYNTLTRQKEEFVPLNPENVRMYVCGMTVYDYCHLGHARVLVVFDMIARWLRQHGYPLTYVRNITAPTKTAKPSANSPRASSPP